MVWRAGRVQHAPAARPGGVAGEVVQALVQLAQRASAARSTTSPVGGGGGHHDAHAFPDVERGRAPAPRCGRRRRPGSTAMARYSDAIATQSSVSAITAGLQAIGSRKTAKPSRGADREGVEAVEVVEAVHQRVVQRVALAQAPRQVAGGDLGVVLGVELDALAAQLAAQAVVVRQRAVVHEAEVEAGREGVRAERRDARSRSPCGCARGRGCRGCRRARTAPRTRSAGRSPCRSRSPSRRSSRARRGAARAPTPARRRHRPSRPAPRGRRGG